MVAFGSVVAALGCAVAMQRRVAEHNRAGSGPVLEVRVGLHAGEPVRDGGDVHGEAVVVAKRLCDLAAGGQIFASELVTNLVGSRGGFSFRPLGRLQLKGLPGSMAAVELRWDAEGQDDLPTLQPLALRLEQAGAEPAGVHACMLTSRSKRPWQHSSLRRTI